MAKKSATKTPGIRDRIKELRRVKASELLADPRNWRLHPLGQKNALKGLLDEVGYADALLARELPDGRLMLVDGHLRAETTPDEIVPVLVLDLNEAEAGKVLATLDPLAGMAEMDCAKLDALLREVDIGNADVQKMLDDLAEDAGLASAPDPQQDEVPSPPKVPVTRIGDLWILGTHRLLCGDSTKPADVARVMNGERAGLMNTDPPYGVSYANDDRPNPGVAKPRVANDELADEKLQAFLESVFKTAVDTALAEKSAWYLWHAHLTQGYFAAAAAAAANVVLHRQIIWVKPVLLLGRGHYHWKHEPCFMGWVKGRQPPDYGEGNGERTQTTVWELKSVSQADRKEFDHSTPKPVELFSIPILKHLQAGEICFEPFAGSGPQFIAAQQLGRRCFGVELEPNHCDVICERYRKASDNPPVLESTGQTFDEVRAERLSQKAAAKSKKAKKRSAA
jgi:DNA modification methylase